MLPRIWIALLAVLLLAAPADSRFAEVADSQSISFAGSCDDGALPAVEVVPAGGAPRRMAGAVTFDDTVPSAPVLARIFRPPRPGARPS